MNLSHGLAALMVCFFSLSLNLSAKSWERVIRELLVLRLKLIQDPQSAWKTNCMESSLDVTDREGEDSIPLLFMPLECSKNIYWRNTAGLWSDICDPASRRLFSPRYYKFSWNCRFPFSSEGDAILSGEWKLFR